jgi:hypothetical protein
MSYNHSWTRHTGNTSISIPDYYIFKQKQIPTQEREVVLYQK